MRDETCGLCHMGKKRNGCRVLLCKSVGVTWKT